MNKADSKAVVIPASKSGAKVQIALPKLCNYDDDDEDDDEEEDEDEKEAAKLVITKPQPQANAAKKAASGLLGILPQPKANLFTNAKQDSAAKAETKSTQPATSSGLFLPRTLNSNVKKPVSVLDEDDAIRQRNFKRFKGDNELNTKAVGRNLQPKQFIADYKDFETEDPEIVFHDDDVEDEEQKDDEEYEHKRRHEEDEEEEEEHDHNHEQAEQKGPPELNQEALMKLCGKKHAKELINLTEVKANEIMGDNRSNLMKQITKEWKPPSNKDYFGSGSRRTHHITYLA